MYKIYKITSHPVVDFSAEELKRYLRMMMPRCGEIDITYDPTATDGFRLGLMEDFGLSTAEAEDLVLDDILHIDIDENGGIIAGSNPRSILQAVYKYLTLHGCRWLFPGVDGEFIPIANIAPTYFHKMADCRYRGQCNEGAESQQCMLDTIDFSPKIGLNTYMMEFDIPMVYYRWYYSHRLNTANREPEPVTLDTVLQWKRACEAEIAKRGMQFHDIGHGWTAEAFGISTLSGWHSSEDTLSDESRSYLAMINGERGLFHGIALNTNFCMSNPEARDKVTNMVCDYAEKNPHVTYLHVWLADGAKNHCECDACRVKTPSDWYVILVNEIDEALTARNLDTRIVFCAYSDTAWEPTCEYIKNPKRFSLLLGAISRSYTYSVPKNPKVESFTPFRLNDKAYRISTQEEYIQRLNRWKEYAPCNTFAYEYHFWKHQFYAPGVLSFARRLYEDVLSYRDNGFKGIIEDGSQRSFFPNGLCYYVYAATLFDNDVDYDALVEDYLRHAYGDQWEVVLNYFKQIDSHLPQSYLEVYHSFSGKKNNYYRPEMEKTLLEVDVITRQLEEDLKEHHNAPYRVQTVATRLLLRHTEFCRGFAKAMALKAVGKDEEAEVYAMRFLDDFGKYELEIERYYDHMLVHHALDPIFTNRKQLEQ